MVYRINAYKPDQVYAWSRWDVLSQKLVGHPNLFTNIATCALVVVPLWSGIILIMWLVYRLVGVIEHG